MGLEADKRDSGAAAGADARADAAVAAGSAEDGQIGMKPAGTCWPEYSDDTFTAINLLFFRIDFKPMNACKRYIYIIVNKNTTTLCILHDLDENFQNYEKTLQGHCSSPL